MILVCLLASCGDGIGGWFGEPPGVEFSPASLSFEADEGGADPAAQTVTIEVVAFDDGAWTASTTETWLSVSPAAGTGDATLQVSVSVGALAFGDYQAQVIIDCPGTGRGPFSMTVTLTVGPAAQAYVVVDLTTGSVTEQASVPDLVTNDAYKTAKLVLKRIPAGTFQMGDEVGGGEADELPVHAVNITSAFYLGVFEVTQKQWFEVQGDWPSSFTTNPDKRPVEMVSWDDCQGFFSQLSTVT